MNDVQAGEVQRGLIILDRQLWPGYAVEGDPNKIIFQLGKDLVSSGDQSLDRLRALEYQNATTIACAVFSLLDRNRIPVAFLRQVSSTNFIAKNCQMIPLKVIVRRYASKHYSRRYPNFVTGGAGLHWFRDLVLEFFLKTDDGRIISKNGSLLAKTPIDEVSGSDLPIADPLISNPRDSRWILSHPNLSLKHKRSNIGMVVPSSHVLPQNITVNQIESLSRRVFETLERVWDRFNYRLINLEIEFGVDSKGHLVVTAAIDSRSWCLYTRDWEESFEHPDHKDNDLSGIADRCAQVAKLAQLCRKF